jgi:hypothetical protein
MPEIHIFDKKIAFIKIHNFKITGLMSILEVQDVAINGLRVCTKFHADISNSF